MKSVLTLSGVLLVLQVLLWAGEHTHNTRYGTVDGAMDTGNTEALRILGLLKWSSQ